LNWTERKNGKSKAQELNSIRRAYRTASPTKKRQLKQMAEEIAARAERNKSSVQRRQDSE
jgi:hypothetical protein